MNTGAGQRPGACIAQYEGDQRRDRDPLRPTGPKELELVAESGYRRWPPCLPEQPIFYPVLNEDYAIKIARDWNVRASGIGYVTKFAVSRGSSTARRFSRSAVARSWSTGSLRRIWKPSTTTSLG